MAGVAQVWLTAEELEAIAQLYDAYIKDWGERQLTPADVAAREKIEAALAPVACDTASGAKTP